MDCYMTLAETGSCYYLEPDQQMDCYMALLVGTGSHYYLEPEQPWRNKDTSDFGTGTSLDVGMHNRRYY